MQVLTALVQERATLLIDHGLSDTLLALLSHYHDQAWCRPLVKQGRACSAAMLGSFADLPCNAFAMILQQLDVEDLVQLHTATMARVPAIRERLLQAKYGRRWLQLTRRMPGPGCSAPRVPIVESHPSESEHSASGTGSWSDWPGDLQEEYVKSEAEGGGETEDEEEGEEGEGEEDNYSDQSEKLMVQEKEQLWRQLRETSKHSLLQMLRQQICHTNDVAALIDDWVDAHAWWWSTGSEELGWSGQAAFGYISYNI